MLRAIAKRRVLPSNRNLRFFSAQTEEEQSTSPSTSDVVDEKYLNRPVTYPLNKIKVVLLENIHPTAVRAFEKEGFSVETHTGALSGKELAQVGGDAHILGIRSKSQLDPSFFDTVGELEHRLWAVGCFCIGTNQVALPQAAARGVPVFNAPFSNTRSVAEKTLSEVIALHRKLFQRSTQLHRGEWQKSASGAHEVRGTTLGIVGYGRIGSQISVLAELLGMNVIFYDPLKRLPLGNARQVDSLEDMLSQADAVTLHVPATDDTKRMMNTRTISKMKDGALLINNARGSVVDLDAAAEAVKSGKLGGLAVDVFPVEPAKNGEAFDTPLRGLENVILTPHIGGSTEEAQANIATEVSSKLIRYLNEGTTTTSVNTPELDLMPVQGDTMRILHFHRNVPGVLSKVHGVISNAGINVTSQNLVSDPLHAYLSLEVDKIHSQYVTEELEKIDETIFLRTIV